jgi:hypothetical protein
MMAIPAFAPRLLSSSTDPINQSSDPPIMPQLDSSEWHLSFVLSPRYPLVIHNDPSDSSRVALSDKISITHSTFSSSTFIYNLTSCHESIKETLEHFIRFQLKVKPIIISTTYFGDSSSDASYYLRPSNAMSALAVTKTSALAVAEASVPTTSIILSHLPSFWRGLKMKFGRFPELLNYKALSKRFPSSCVRVRTTNQYLVFQPVTEDGFFVEYISYCRGRTILFSEQDEKDPQEAETALLA